MTSTSGKKTRLWLDDERPAPDDSYISVSSVEEAIRLLESDDGYITEVSFDHDLGRRKTGYDFACWIEEQAHAGTLHRLKWDVHSQNPVGRQRVEAALQSAERFWDEQDQRLTTIQVWMVALTILLAVPTVALLARLLLTLLF